MTHIENPLRLVRELKGASLFVLVALLFVHSPVTQNWLQCSTGYTDKPISKALTYLQEVGLVIHAPPGWSLSESVSQLPLPLVPISEMAQSRNNSDSRLATNPSPHSFLFVLFFIFSLKSLPPCPSPPNNGLSSTLLTITCLPVYLFPRLHVYLFTHLPVLFPSHLHINLVEA